MPKFLRTRGKSTLAIAICDRCHQKFPYDELFPDPNSPGLRVCRKDLDLKDPYKLPPRQTEKIALRYPRPEVDIAVVGTVSEDITESPGSVILPDGTPAPVPAPEVVTPPIVLPDVTPLPPVVAPPPPPPPPVYTPPPDDSGATPIPSPTPSPPPPATPPSTPPPTAIPDPQPTLSQSLIDELCGDMCFREDFDSTTLNGDYWEPTMAYEVEGQSAVSYNNPDFSEENWAIEDSKLKIWPQVNADGNFYRKTFSTNGKFFLRNGIWEASLKLPRGKGCWPAFWLYNSDTFVEPIYRPEIDVMEAYPGGGVDSGWSDADLNPINFGATVWDAPWNGGNQTRLFDKTLAHYYPTERLDTDFHKYTVIVHAGKIRFFYDGLAIGGEVTGGSMDYRYYAILDLWFGSASGEPNTTDTPQGSSNSYEIEYLYAWKLKDDSSVITGTGPLYTPNSGTPTQSPAPTPTPTPPAGIWPYGREYSDFSAAVFQEEFDTTTLDSSKWSDNGITTYDISAEALRQWPESPFSNQQVSTSGKYTREHGYFEWDLKAPIGEGVRPYFGLKNGQFEVGFQMYCGAPLGDWSDSSDHPIDFATTVYIIASDTVVFSERQSAHTAAVDLSAASHKYAIEWTSTHVRFLWDGTEVGSYAHGGAVVGPAYIFINLDFVTNESSAGAGTPTGNTNSQTTEYVRVWPMLVDASTPGTGTGPAPVGEVPNHIVEYHGDSFIYGYDGAAGGGRVANPSPHFLATAFPNITVRNEGVNSSDTTKLLAGTDGVHAAWSTYLASTDCDIVVVSFGYSDTLDLTVEQFKTNLRTIYDQADAAGKLVIFQTTHVIDSSMGTGFDLRATAMSEVATEKGAGFIEMYTYTTEQFTGSLLDWIPDGYHPNQAAYQIIGERAAAMYAAEYNALVDAATPTPTPPPPGQPQEYPYGQDSALYTLPVFWDEFTGNTLNTGVWNDAVWYQSSHPDINYAVSNGSLLIWPLAPFVNRTIDTDGKYYQRGGFFEAYMKLNIGRGCWPAFWLFGHPGDLRPEIDIMEAYPGGGPDSGWSDADLHPITYAATVWNPDVSLSGSNVMTAYMPAQDLSAGFHRYGVKWDSGTCTFYFDGQQMGPAINASQIWMDLYILFDLWFGSASGTPNTAETPQGTGNAFEIRYVRAWQFK